MTAYNKRTPDGGSRRGSGVHRNRIEYGKPSVRTPLLPANWRNRVCCPLDVYKQHVPGLTAPDPAGMVTGSCSLCADRSGVFRANVQSASGPWRCDGGCGGGDLIGFAQRLFGLTFPKAVRALIKVRP